MTTVGERAVSRGYLVPDHDAEGTVHSVFTNACNIAMGDLLVTVHDLARAHTPTSVRVIGDGPGPWAPHTTPGDRACSRGGSLIFGAHVLDVRGTSVWRPRPPREGAPCPGDQHALRRSLTGLAQARRAHDVGTPAERDRLEQDVERLHTLLLVRGEPANLDAAVRRLVGAGPGLTPSGDDALVGLMAALHRGGHGQPAATRAFGALGAAVARHLERTSDVSAHHLALASTGHTSEPLTELLDALVGEAPATDVRRRTREVLEVGATSGGDALLGVITGLDIVLASAHATHPPTAAHHEKAA